MTPLPPHNKGENGVTRVEETERNEYGALHPKQDGRLTNRQRAYDCAKASRRDRIAALRGIIYALCDVADAIREEPRGS